MHYFRNSSVAVLAFCLAWHGWIAAVRCEAPQAPTDAAEFDARVAPLLARRCLECHNASDKKGGLDLASADAAATGGDSGAVLVPGNVEQSLLWQRIEADEMPPKKPLPADEKELLRVWIAGGAKWGAGPINPFRYSTDSRAGYDWWSLQTVRPVDLPPVANAAWPRNPIDHFVLASLEAAGLAPSPQAGKRTLIRRLSFDLLGLPPSPGDVAAFLADDSPRAYENLVDRLLDSPHYGERWARHWLDVIRFGESQGFERDKLRANAWPYRDWVIAALNDDLPYDEFVRLQLAGDVLRPDDPLAVIATGFLVAGAYDEVGQTQQSAAMRAVVRQDELEDIVAVVAQSFLGLTVNCARCHNHKFDPVKQSEYYQLCAALGGVRHGERDPRSAAGQPRAEELQHAIQPQVDELARQLAQITAPARERLANREQQPATMSPPAPIARWEFEGNLDDALGTLHGTAHGNARLDGGMLVLDGADSYVATAPLAAPLKAKTLEAWVALANLEQRGGAALSVQRLDGELFDAIVYGERDPGQWMAGSNGFTRTQTLGGPVETAAAGELVQVALVYQEDQTIAAYRNGLPYGSPYKASSLQAFEAGQAQVVFGLRHAPPGGNKMLAARIGRAQLYDRALAPDEVAASAGVRASSVTDDEVVSELSPGDRQRYEELTLDLSRLQTRQRLLAGGMTYLVNPRQPETTNVLRRGDTRQPGEVAVPAGIAALGAAAADFGLAADAAETERRLRLARWIANPANPLTARVIANRLWHYHFGTGLVATPNDFGFNGARPTHPQLLDWLAGDLVRHGWSLKHLHRTIVTSAAYRQDSKGNPAAAAVDAESRLLWRKTPQRLEAEALRDAVLAVAGELHPLMGGPGYQDFRTFTFNSQFYENIDPAGLQYNRRSIYRTWVRSGTNPLLDVLDCPDPSATAPRRAVTTTPLQALALLNDSFVLRMAERFASRLERECGGDLERQVRQAGLLAFAREPADDEVAVAKAFIAEHGLWAYCRVLFNSNEFLYVD